MLGIQVNPFHQMWYTTRISPWAKSNLRVVLRPHEPLIKRFGYYKLDPVPLKKEKHCWSFPLKQAILLLFMPYDSSLKHYFLLPRNHSTQAVQAQWMMLGINAGYMRRRGGVTRTKNDWTVDWGWGQHAQEREGIHLHIVCTFIKEAYRKHRSTLLTSIPPH